MGRSRDLSGFGSGSHIILDTHEPSHQRLAIPVHAALRAGTLHAIPQRVREHKAVSRDSILETL